MFDPWKDPLAPPPRPVRYEPQQDYYSRHAPLFQASRFARPIPDGNRHSPYELPHTSYRVRDDVQRSVTQRSPYLPQRNEDRYGRYPDLEVFAPTDSDTSARGASTMAPLQKFLFDKVPRQIYMHLLLRMPALYLSRVTRIYNEAEMTIPEIQRMVFADRERKFDLESLSPADSDLKATWEAFIDSLLREWKTLNIISVLLLSTILSTLQIDGGSGDPVIRYTALFSLICALMSLFYGCVYIIRFASMKATHKAAEWVIESQKSKSAIFWNVWVLLAMPAVWLAWSILLYITCIMTFIWRTGTASPVTSSTMSQRSVLGPRIAISAVLGLGIIYFCLILDTLGKYGTLMDKAWEDRVAGWRRVHVHGPRRSSTRFSTEYSNQPPTMYASSPAYHYPSTKPRYPKTDTPVNSVPATANLQAFPPLQGFHTRPNVFTPVKILDFPPLIKGAYPMPDHLIFRGIQQGDWQRFTSETARSWDAGHENIRGIPMQPQDHVAEVIKNWNATFFIQKGTWAVLCQEYLPGFPDSPTFAVYLIDWTSTSNPPLRPIDCFPAVPAGLERIDLLDPPVPHTSRGRVLGQTSLFSTQQSTEGQVPRGTAPWNAEAEPATSPVIHRRTSSESTRARAKHHDNVGISNRPGPPAPVSPQRHFPEVPGGDGNSSLRSHRGVILQPSHSKSDDSPGTSGVHADK